jgi:hypothetical protein
MNFDINEIVAQMVDIVKTNVSENWEEVRNVTNQFLQRKKERLELLADLRITGEISQERFESRLKDEELIMEAELHAIAVITKAKAQKAANAAIDVLKKAVMTAIGIIK